jgi:hypothetical protein
MAITNLTSARPKRAAYLDRGCSVCQALDTLPDAEAGALRSLLGDPAWRYSALSEALAEDPDNPLDLPAEALGRHARGGCARREKLRG